MVDKKQKEQVTGSEKKAALPSLTILFGDSWELFTKTIISYIKVILLGIGFIFLLAMLGTLFALPVTFSSVSAPLEMFRDPTVFELTNIIVLAVWFITVILVVVVFSLLLPIASIKILNGEKEGSTFDLLKDSMRLFFPYLVVSLLSTIIILGGYFALFIPGILFSLFFLFVGYQVVIEKSRGRGALVGSYELVKTHFWQVLGRYVLLGILLYSVSYMLELLSEQNALFSFLTIIISLFAGWFAQSYLFTLYKQIKAKSHESANASIRWIWIVALIGWILFVATIILLQNAQMDMPIVV